MKDDIMSPNNHPHNAAFEYVGNLHVHSLYSDGAGTVHEIAHSAKQVGLDFIILNDHSYMTDSLHLQDEGFYEGLLVLLGLEIGGRYHHYLAYDLKEMIHGRSLGPQEVIDEVNAQGGFGFLAHPFEKGMPFTEKSLAYTWNDLSVTGFTGVCIWNFSSRWKERIKSVFHGLFFLLFKSQFLKGPSQKTLSFWDKLCQQKKTVGIGGSDAHGSLFRWHGIRITPLSYAFLLNSINIHILTGKPLSANFVEAKTAIYEALRHGRAFIVHENLAPAKGFNYYFVSDEGWHLNMGEERPFQPGTLFIGLPKEGEIRLIRDGIVESRWRGKQVSLRVEQKGVYRVEVYRRILLFGWRPWIFSNPIYLR
jgi:hypothetical protein